MVAEGAYGAGAVPLNVSGFDGWNAWETWGGTSRSAPVAMGNLALVYQAFKENSGAWPTYDVARQILMSGASNVHYDVFSQGAGSVNADRATDVAGGHGGVYVGPDNWTAGDYRGTEYGGFANIVHPGDAASQTFSIYNPSPRDITVSLSDDVLVKTGEMEFGFTTDDISKEDEYEGREDPPQYIVRNVTEDIPVGTDLLVVRMRYDYADFDLDGDYDVDNNWWLLPYDWMDVNSDGEWWKDLNGNGVLNYGEMDPGEFVRFAHNGNDPDARGPLGVYWYELSRGSSTIGWTKHIISLGEHIGSSLSIPVVDMDGDGDLDVVVTGKWGGPVYLENSTK